MIFCSSNPGDFSRNDKAIRITGIEITVHIPKGVQETEGGDAIKCVCQKLNQDQTFFKNVKLMSNK